MEPASDEEEAASSSGPAPRSAPLASARPAGEIFAVTNPPSKRLPPPPVSGKAAGKRRNTNLPVTTVRAGTSSSKVSPAANYQVERPDKRARGNDLLDARVALDPDENYNENERALTEFIRLHPMLSLDATSERMLTCVASMIGDYAAPTVELETVSKAHDDLFLRKAKPHVGERECVNGQKCVCRWTAIFRHGETTDKAFVCREFLLPSQQELFVRDGTLPKNVSKCLMCQRYFTSFVYTLARTSPSFCPTSELQIQVFGNKVASTCAADDAVTATAKVGSDDGYLASKMLFVDEKWADAASSRGSAGTLLWRPVVRFNCADYVFEKDVDGEPIAVQVGMQTKIQDFGQPPLAAVQAAEACSEAPRV